MQCPLEIINLQASRDLAVLDFSYSYSNVPVHESILIRTFFATSGKHEFLITALYQVNVNVRLPVVLSKFLQGVPLSPADFVSQWRALTGPPLKLVEVVCFWITACFKRKMQMLILIMGSSFDVGSY